MTEIKNNIHDVALIFEGGGMRNSYSSGVVNVMLENEFFFNAVYGLSAGATNAVNYLSRDTRRSEISFTEYTDGFEFRKTFRFLLEEDERHRFGTPKQQAQEGVRIPFDFDSFAKNPAQLTLSALDRNSGQTIYFTNEDFDSEEELMQRVHASTCYPVIMSPQKVDGRLYYDGGIGEGGGILTSRAQANGFERFFVVCTRPKGFRKPLKPNRLYDFYFWNRPHMRKALHTWSKRYNTELDKLERLEAEGKAYVFYAEEQGVSNTERTVEKLKANFEEGYKQAERELDAWVRFLEL